MLSEVQVRPVRPTCQDNPEKWLTKKKVEIVTTKNIEKTIKRQLVLEDGRILDEDIPIVTLDTTENKEVFETDHDEERDNLDYNKMVQMNIGDKVTTLRTTKDVKENVTKTEASQNIGSIANRDLPRILKDKNHLGSSLRSSSQSSRDLAVVPVVVQNSRSHTTVTDTEQINQRNVFKNGRMVTEKVRTEQHEEYESVASETSDDESDFEKIEYEELYQDEPLEYKTKTEESFIEYFKMGSDKNKQPSMEMVGEGPYYKTVSKQYNKKNNSTSSNNNPTPRKPLKQSRSWDNDREDKIGKMTALTKQHSNSLGDLSRNKERIFIAKVIEETPTVKLRNKKKKDINKYIEHRNSANVLFRSDSKESSRCSTPTSREYHFPNCRVKNNQRERPMSLDITNRFFAEDLINNSSQYKTSTIDRNSKYYTTHKNFHSNLDLSEKPKQIEIKIESPTSDGSDFKLIPKHYSSTDNLLSREKQICTKSLVRKGEKFQSVGDICFTTSKEIPNVGREVAIKRNVNFATPVRNERKTSGRLVFTSEKPQFSKLRPLEHSYKTTSCTNLSTRVIPIDLVPMSAVSAMSSPSSPAAATKYRTRVAVHGAAK